MPRIEIGPLPADQRVALPGSAGQEPADLSDDLLDTLSWLRTLSSRLAAVRAARGGVVFDRYEDVYLPMFQPRDPGDRIAGAHVASAP